MEKNIRRQILACTHHQAHIQCVGCRPKKKMLALSKHIRNSRKYKRKCGLEIWYENSARRRTKRHNLVCCLFPHDKRTILLCLSKVGQYLSSKNTLIPRASNAYWTGACKSANFDVPGSFFQLAL